MKKLCHCRFDNGIYLLTCLLPKGHAGSHMTDEGETWGANQGWWDVYGDSPEMEKVRAPPPPPEWMVKR